MTGRIGVACLLACGGIAHADHHDMARPDGDGESSFSAGVSVLTATFSPSLADQMYYEGSYQGVIPSLRWAMDRYGASLSWAYYWLDRNGASYNGVGDLVAHGQAALLVTHDAQAGAMLSASWPTGAETFGLGMGHPMLMPAVWGTWRLDRVELSGSAGYSWAVASGGHVHGMQPLVEPMNMSELTWGAAADVAVGGGVRLGARLAGGVPIVQAGDDRMIGAVHAAWGVHRIDTAAELQVGLLGDPFNIRAVLSTALRF